MVFPMKCPACGFDIPTSLAASAMGQKSSKSKTKAARANGKLGGWTKGNSRISAIETAAILQTLLETDNNIAEAARLLGMSKNKIYRRIRVCGWPKRKPKA
ncbi:MAG: hypothetical protein JWQ87_5481 [Candidatus Sulfotelmatobacter sp.]|nr:hypothetical protein [Candidatus Sulfotelmatobacter sp.]